MPKLNCTFFFDSRLFVLVIIISLLILIFIFFKFLYKSWVDFIALGMIIGGGSVNLFQRYKFGCVKEHFQAFTGFYFNTWDLLIVVGMGIMIYRLLSVPKVR